MWKIIHTAHVVVIGVADTYRLGIHSANTLIHIQFTVRILRSVSIRHNIPAEYAKISWGGVSHAS